MKYEIEQTARHLILGVFEAHSAEQALRMMYVRAGYWDGVHPHDAEGNELGGQNTIVVRELDTRPATHDMVVSEVMSELSAEYYPGAKFPLVEE